MGSEVNGGGGHSMSRQASLYNLTLNEVQNQLGEPLHNMNLDDLLRSVLPPEGGDRQFTIDMEGTCPQAEAFGSRLELQGSWALVGSLSKKTVDEVWRDIQNGQSSKRVRQPTLGEMTLEDFLVKAGIIDEEKDNAGPGGVGEAIAGVQRNPGGTNWLQPHYQTSSLQQQGGEGVVSGYIATHPVVRPSIVVMDAGLDGTQIGVALSDPPSLGRKRVATNEVTEKTVERKQKRMIKNRESAARSRARKQAYTNELENKISRLEEENEMLKKQKELDKILYTAPLMEPKFHLRRTNSNLL